MSGGAVLVTGAGGFVCSEFALALARAGHEVVATDRRFDAATRGRLADMRRVEAPLAEALTGIGPVAAVVHGAALTAEPERLGLTAAGHLARNVGMLTATLDAAREAGAGRFVFLSSMGVFAPDDGSARDGRVTEAISPTGICPYAAAKRAGEIVTTAAADARMATLSLRLGNIAGPHEAVRESRQHLCLLGRMLAEARADGRITVRTPDALRDWSWLPDLADGIAALVGAERWEGPALRHAGTPPSITDLALAQAIAARIPGVTVEPSPPPHPALRPPMGSGWPGALSAIRWTRPEAMIDALLARVAA